MFPSTLPAGAPELMRISDFRRYLQQSQDRGDRTTTRLSSLSPSLLQDLLRFEREGRGSELLEVIAAALRHGRNLLIHLGLEAHVIPLTVFPAERLAQICSSVAAHSWSNVGVGVVRSRPPDGGMEMLPSSTSCQFVPLVP